VVGTRLGAVLKQPVVVENRPGAGGAVGGAYAAKQPADGYTLVMEVESSHAVSERLSEDGIRPGQGFRSDQQSGGRAQRAGGQSVVPAQDMAAFIKLLKASPGKYSFGSSGNGGLSHMNGELFMSVTGTKMLHVPYKGLGPALNDAMAGQIQVVFDNIPSSSA
jgi:tripartite-type tricarboxylate transporter receptor subunit TctC